MLPSEKAAILKGLKDAYAAKLKEQDRYRAQIEALQEAAVPANLSDHLEMLDWERIEKHMEGLSWPPSCQDWQEFKGLAFDKTPKQKILNQMADKDVRFHTYHYSELAEHTRRLKAMAHFYGLFGAVNDDVTLWFLAWKEVAKLKTLEHVTP
jgi:hypothetical protein